MTSFVEYTRNLRSIVSITVWHPAPEPAIWSTSWHSERTSAWPSRPRRATERLPPAITLCLASDTPGALERGRPNDLARPRHLAHPAGRAAASKRRAGRGAAQKTGPAGSTAIPLFFFSLPFSFTSLLVVCLDGLQIGPLANLFVDYLLALFISNK
jgi:hypothetical protein